MGFDTCPGVSFCVVGGQPVFLDLIRDRYFGLAPIPGAAFLRLIGDGPNPSEDDPEIKTLVARGLLRVTNSTSVPTPCRSISTPIFSALDTAGPSSQGQRWRSASAIMAARAHLRFSGLRRSLERVARRKRHLLSNVAAKALPDDFVAGFRDADLMLGSLNLCVPRSLALMTRALRWGAAPELAIGVKLRPFGAHCWIQQENVLLNERIEVSRDFTPIFII